MKPPMEHWTGSLTNFSEWPVNSVTSNLTLANISALWFDSTSIPCFQDPDPSCPSCNSAENPRSRRHVHHRLHSVWRYDFFESLFWVRNLFWELVVLCALASYSYLCLEYHRQLGLRAHRYSDGA
ncbi:uncharacterized protein LOC112527388 [Cynara cardunculus var. scolymus]|uniref:uncharacterized protein LOC112527388 n=1 Tax=Cynara cardunculus var. scolymus TaxID=59895 RepID=UPI000D62731B|nr:uncharacterized protein LOC112527388 [Cynara cardunculus var. scolymus]